MMRPLRILIVNAKGGCGKTTIATNLAVAYARQGLGVALVDQDSQGSAEAWAHQREASLAKVEFVAQRRATMYQTQAWRDRLPHGVERAVIDAASVATERNLDDYFRESDAFLVPMLPSPIDIRAGGKFIDSLLNHRSYRSHPVPIGVLANRVVKRAVAYDRLTRFLERLPVPTVATFADSQLYLHAAEVGAGILDFPHDSRFAAERGEWSALLRWLEAALADKSAPPARPSAQAGKAAAAERARSTPAPMAPRRAPLLAAREVEPAVGA